MEGSELIKMQGEAKALIQALNIPEMLTQGLYDLARERKTKKEGSNG